MHDARLKKSLALIQLGTFLEYFDLVLYIHMAVILNKIFFMDSDPYTASLLATLTFSSTYVLRPLGALFFGYLGDHYGRKSTVVITTLLMSLCSFTIASLPGYAEIGIASSIILIICRMLQGFSSVGEFIGAQVYISEITKPPRSYFYTSMVIVSASLGGVFALLIANLLTFLNPVNGWRTAFYFGSAIALVGSIARNYLRETPEFLKGRRERNKDKNAPSIIAPKNYRKNLLCYVGIDCIGPMCFYLTFIYLGGILGSQYGLDSYQIIRQNLYVAIIDAIFTFLWARSALRFYPFKVLKFRGSIFLCVGLVLPFLASWSTSPLHIFMIQMLLVIFGPSSVPADALLIRSFPIIGRYTSASLAYALSRMIMYPLTSFGCFFVGQYFGFPGIAGVLCFFTCLYLVAVRNFQPAHCEITFNADIPEQKTSKKTAAQGVLRSSA
ncbi:MAG: MFS transporter [Alphaproteobacteria bacterium]|nr:MFS transporter [Alphaproteobacteria bacterium]